MGVEGLWWRSKEGGVEDAGTPDVTAGLLMSWMNFCISAFFLRLMPSNAVPSIRGHDSFRIVLLRKPYFIPILRRELMSLGRLLLSSDAMWAAHDALTLPVSFLFTPLTVSILGFGR